MPHPSMTNKLIQHLLETIGRRRMRSSLRRFANANDPSLMRVGSVFARTLANRVSAEEAAWVRQIENLRGALCEDGEVLRITDFGAGDVNQGTVADGTTIHRTVSEICRTSAGRPLWCRLLFHLVREFRPEGILEMGTSLGISTAYCSAACNLNGNGKVVTLEGAGALVDKAARNMERLGLQNIVVVEGRFQDTLPGVLREHGPFQLAFVDGHHDGDATLAYLETLAPHLAPDAIVLFDDIAWSTGMRNAWSIIRRQQRFKATVGLFEIGLCVLERNADAEPHPPGARSSL